MEKGKRGMGNVSKVVGGIIIILFILSLLIALFNYNSGNDFIDSFVGSIKMVFTGFASILGYLINAEGENAYIMIISFILITVIVVGTLDIANIFGEDNWLINFVVGIIVSIIGVRFMPSNLWLSLTTPSSAFVATVLVGAPFLALAFLTVKMNSRLVGKLIWIFYVIMLSYLVFEYGDNGFKGVYIIFLFLGGLMMFFDGTVRRFVSKEREEAHLGKELIKMDVKRRYELRENIKEWAKILSDPGASTTEKDTAKAELANLRKQYGQDLSII